MEIDTLFETGRISLPVESNLEEWSLSATGDYGVLPQLERTIAEEGLDKIAGTIRDLITADISISNLEIALCENGEVGENGVRGDRGLFDRFHEAVPFSIYSFANNHILDAGEDALRKTFVHFENKGISYVGAGSSRERAEKPLFVEVKGVKLGILAFAQKENQIAGDNSPGAAELVPELVLQAASALIPQCDVPVVIMHDGFEFMNFPRLEFRNLCRRLVDIGVKLVIGHHSHVPQGIEYIDNSLIFYSLGNFLFDQPHFKPYDWSRKSFVPVITFRGFEISSIELRPLIIETEPLNLRQCNKGEEEKILSHLKKNSQLIADEEKFKQGIEDFYTNILMPEFLGFIKQYGNENNGDYSALIQRFKGQIPVHNLFSGFLSLYAQ